MEQGGVTRKEAYAQKLRDPRWQRKRLEIMGRDEFKCQLCGDTTSTLHVHHTKYVGLNPWDTPDEFLVTICEPCHNDEHGIEQDKDETEFEHWCSWVRGWRDRMVVDAIEFILGHIRSGEPINLRNCVAHLDSVQGCDTPFCYSLRGVLLLVVDQAGPWATASSFWLELKHALSRNPDALDAVGEIYDHVVSELECEEA